MRLLDPTPSERREPAALLLHDVGYAHVACGLKTATEKPQAVKALKGRLFKSQSGWILLAVPNALVRGAFDALDEPGVQLPLKDGRLDAHISVMRPAELENVAGGADAITERGKFFSYQLGPVKTVRPHGWEGMSRVWFIEVHSPELQQLRRSYGLTALPKNNEFRFHITIGARPTNVLRDNEQSKAAAEEGATDGEEGKVSQEEANYRPASPAEQAAGMVCGQCVHFDATGQRCEVVEGSIGPEVAGEPVTSDLFLAASGLATAGGDVGGLAANSPGAGVAGAGTGAGLAAIEPAGPQTKFKATSLVQPIGAPAIGSGPPEIPEAPKTASAGVKRALEIAQPKKRYPLTWKGPWRFASRRQWL